MTPEAIAELEPSNATKAPWVEPRPVTSGGEGDDLRPRSAAMLATYLRSPKVLAIAGGVLALIVILVVALGGDDKPSGTKVSAKTAKQTQPVEKPADEPVQEVGSAEPIADPNAGNAGSAEPTEPMTGSADPNAAAATTETPTGATTTDKPVDKPADKPADKPVRKPPTLGGKQVVLEYDTQARENKPVPAAVKADQGAISRARGSYAAGNQKLFAGDADSAIKYYQQSLGYYPGYVAGYRGLGLAYAQKGDKVKALKALRTYVGVAPNAKDAPIIRKRIASLQGK